VVPDLTDPAPPVIAVSLIDPLRNSPDVGYLLGFQFQAQPITIDFPFSSTTKWSSSIGNGFQSSLMNGFATANGVILVGNSTASDLILRTYVLSGTSFTLSPDSIPVNQTSPSWITDTPVFIAAIVEPMDPNNILFSAQRDAGPVIFQVPFPSSEVQPERMEKVRSRKRDSNELQIAHQAVVCPSPLLYCEVLDSVNSQNCGGECCQNYLPSGESDYVTACCLDCGGMGTCQGNPGQCSG
jgi:hypothetical protein